MGGDKGGRIQQRDIDRGRVEGGDPMKTSPKKGGQKRKQEGGEKNVGRNSTSIFGDAGCEISLTQVFLNALFYKEEQKRNAGKGAFVEECSAKKKIQKTGNWEWTHFKDEENRAATPAGA